ncbi:E3 ubiquitin-protein ligase RMA1H1 isoform X2 [Ziziphus jujuba]|uniref:E3 ubiquitin-protein ligase RMA n=1 Tax=Ziziphus jujuba TaxID=326968 RepID=A0A6P6GJL5_ZIZJJ|nr:E3 ubiquitin-protein ligase RMA1H1 isoform X2 [Ziziphus jujuba]
MDLQQYFAHEWKSIPGAVNSENSNGCFDCNICLDFAHEPVVTLCGHLYCWPCIYKWLHVQSASLASDEHPQCPVCKADISHTTMVPLYGRGQTSSEAELEGKAAYKDMVIPPRPSACIAQALMSPMSHTGFHHPMIGMFGEMVYARVFGNSESLYSYPNSYHLVGNSSSRLRRQEMQANKSLNRVSIFLFCCFLLCLIVF